MEIVLFSTIKNAYYRSSCSLGKPEFTEKKDKAKVFTDPKEAIKLCNNLFKKGFHLYLESKE